MIDHVSITVRSVRRSEKFYDAVMEALGHAKVGGDDCWLGYGERKAAPGSGSYLSVDLEVGDLPGESRRHWAFTAPDRAAVEKFHATALAHGGTCYGPPGLRPQYHENYFAAFVLDPDGNRIEAVCHGAE